MKDSKIEWTDHTWNPWRGCTKTSPGCVNCYAETLGHRFGIEWGPEAIRVEKSEAGWLEPLRWAKRGVECGGHAVHWTVPGGARSGWLATHRKARVFALSLGDWLEGDPLQARLGKPVGGVPVRWLARMLDVIRQTPKLNWILVTKRPENFERRMQAVGYHTFTQDGPRAPLVDWLGAWLNGNPPRNVCVMASVEDQQRAEDRIPHLLRIPARWHGLSLEPLLGPVEIGAVPGGMKSPIWHDQRVKIDWLVVGGESGRQARPCNVEWIRGLVRQGREAGCAVFVKQLGAHVCYEEGSTRKRWLLDHRKGGDPSEWTEDLRVREWPEGL